MSDRQDAPDDPFRAYAPPAPVEPSERRANDDGFPPRPSDAPPGTAVVEGWCVILAFVAFLIMATVVCGGVLAGGLK